MHNNLLLFVTNHLYLLVCVSVCPSACIVPILIYPILCCRWNSSAMRRWLKENFLTPGDGTPLHSIDAIEDLQRALASFSGTVRYSTVRYSAIQYVIYSVLHCFDLLYFLLLTSTMSRPTLLY